MQLFFLRHGHAEPAVGITDFERQLTPEGVSRLQVAATVMERLDLGITHLMSSPRTRANQTATVIAQRLGLAVSIHEELNFGFNHRLVEQLVMGLPPDSHVMLVGHEPTFSTVINDLTGATVEMKKGGLARVDMMSRSPIRGVLVWLVAPKVFDVLGQDA